jgi:hypothetical protein
MIHLLLFDLGGTLIRQRTAISHVPEALKTISEFHTADGGRLSLSIVSDYLPPAPPVTEAKIAALEAQFQSVLAAAGLAEFFAPFEKRVTTSTRAGVNKPDRRIFELAIERSGVAASLSECLFITEDEAHLAACRNLGMSVLRFGSGPGIQPAFSDWLRAPLIIAAVVGAAASSNHMAAVRLFLRQTHGLADFEGRQTANTLRGQARREVELHSPRLGPLDGILVEVPVDVTVHLCADGDIDQVRISEPAADTVSDAASFVKSLLDNEQIALPDRPSDNATHAIETDANGRRRLVRRRYSLS